MNITKETGLKANYLFGKRVILTPLISKDQEQQLIEQIYQPWEFTALAYGHVVQ